MAYFLSLILLLLVPVANAEIWTGSGPAPAGYTDLAGWVKDGNGVSSRAFSHDSNGVRSAPTNSTISATSRVNVNSSKGLVPFDVVKTATVDTARVGKGMRALAVVGGPLGISITAATLVCELTTICEDAGKWFTSGDPAYPNYPSSSAYGRYVTGSYTPSNAPTAETSCARYMTTNSFPTGWTSELTSETNCRIKNAEGGTSSDLTVAFQLGTCATGYAYHASSNTCAATFAPAGEATPANWDAIEALLNDNRFVPELLEKKADVPTGVPTLTADQKKHLGLDSVPTKDSSGNITGRQDTNTHIEAIEAGNSDKPGLVLFKETKTFINYDNSNNQISTSTSTSYTNQPQTATPEPPQYTITFDSVENVNLPTYSIPNTYSSTSWGSGTCPADIDVSLSAVTFAIPTAPVCSVAEMINPFVLLFASITSIYIIAGFAGRGA